MSENIASRVKRVVQEQLDVAAESIKPESKFIDDLGCDSLGQVELLLAFEKEFDMDIQDDEAEKIHTVQDAISYIESKAQKKA